MINKDYIVTYGVGKNKYTAGIHVEYEDDDIINVKLPIIMDCLIEHYKSEVRNINLLYTDMYIIYMREF